MRKVAPLLVTALVVLFTVVAPIFANSPLGSTASASAGSPAPPPPPSVVFGSAHNLGWLGLKCTGFSATETLGKDCKKTESNLGSYEKGLGCENLFFTATDPGDSSVKLDKWYINKVNFAACYAKAQNKLDHIKSSRCSHFKKDDGDKSNWTYCTLEEDRMAASVGCKSGDNGGGLFKKSGGYYTQNPSRIAECQAKVDAVGAIQTGRPPGETATQTAKEIAKGNNFNGSSSDGSGGTTGADNEKLQCENSAFALGWIICNIIDGLVAVVEKIDTIITDQMEIKTSTIFCQDGDTCKAYYEAWQSFRNIALGLMVLAALLAIISEALGMEILDAYTIRRALPRVLIAAVAITLSWPLMQFAVQMSNDLGFGIRHLIYAPFTGLNSSIDITFGGSLATAFFGGVGYLLVGAMGILTYVGTAILAVLVAVLVLILRQILITLLIILAPVAIVAYILPNTQKYYKIWWESFIKALLMFPLIAGMIAAGRIFSAVALSTTNGGTVTGFNQLIGFVAYFAPYFMIPLTFKMSGAAMGALGGAVQARAQGGFQALSKKRGEVRADRLQRARSGGIYKGNGFVARNLNRLGSYTLDADEQIVGDIGSGRRLGRLTGGLGKRLLGSQASKMGDDIGSAANKQTLKAAQEIPMQYAGALAALGMLDEKSIVGSGITSPAGRAALIERFGNKGKDGKWDGTYRGIRDNDYQDTMAMANILTEHGDEGSDAQMAGMELTQHAGALSRLKLNPETQRATIGSVSAAIAASEGKLTAADIAKRQNDAVAAGKGDPMARQVAAAERQQLQKLGAAQNQAVREGKGIRTKRDGTAYSVWEQQEKTDLVTGEPIPDGNGGYVMEWDPNAEVALVTGKDAAQAGGKGDYFDETRAATIHFAEVKADGKRTANGEKIVQQLLKQRGTWGGNDPAAKVKIEETLEAIGYGPEVLERMDRGGGEPEAVKAGEGAKKPAPHDGPGAPPSMGGVTGIGPGPSIT